MNTKLKTILLIAALFAFIAGSYFLYDYLKDKTPANDITESESQSESSGSEGQSEAKEEKMKVPDFTVYDKDGNETKLSDHFGKPIVLNFFASWCSPCKSEMPEFNEVYLEKGNEITFMMIDMVDGMQETKEKGEKYVADKGFKFPVYFDTKQSAAYTYGIDSIPTTIFIDKDGYLVTGARGAISKEILLKGIGLISSGSDTASSAATDNQKNPSWCDVTPEYIKISTEDAKRLMGEFEDYKILDVRTKEEFDEKHIENAILLPDTEIAEKIEQTIPDKREVVFVYCRSGRRSELAAKKMVEMGYNHVYDFGGIIDWPYETVK